MEQFKILAYSRPVNIAVGFLLAAIWILFAYRHVVAYATSGHLAFLIFCFSESLQAAFFIFRSAPKTVSLDPFDWTVGIMGTFTPLMFRPGGMVMWQGGEVMVAIAVLMQIAALLSLNRSFAIIAARREIKTHGLYRFVRHPMYASYLILFSGYVLFNGTWLNVGLLMLSLVFLFLRVLQEEKHLSLDADYRAYKECVRYRLVPFLY